MGLLNVLRGQEGPLYECRDCGTTVPPETDECPACDSTEIACYRF